MLEKEKSKHARENAETIGNVEESMKKYNADDMVYEDAIR